MRLAVFGATGETGRLFVQQALARGHEVRALVRPTSSAPDGVEAVTGDVVDAGAVASTIEGTDAVVCILGQKRPEGTIISDGTTNIVRAMADRGSKRLVAVTVHGLNDSMGDAGFFGKVIVGKLGKKRFADRALQERIVVGSDLDWTVLRPLRLVDGDKTGSYELATKMKTGMSAKVRLADVADALLELVESGRHVRETVSIRGT